MTDVENWNADMDAWGLTGSARTHYLWRLHHYHSRIAALHWRRYERARRIEAWFAALLLISLIVMAAGRWLA